MDFNRDYFDLFDLAPAYFVDRADLARRYRELQRVYHPDRAAGKSARDVRLAVQYAARVNEAYETLKSPVSRAQYLLGLKGVNPETETQITRDGAFLMEQMEMREILQDIDQARDPFVALDALESETESRFAELEDEFAVCFDAGEFDAALEIVAKMQFFAKFLHEIEEREADLDQ